MLTAGYRWGLVLLSLALPVRTLFAVDFIHDDAALFSTDAQHRNQEAIERQKDRFHMDVVIETFAAVPAKWQEQCKSSRDETPIAAWASERAEAVGTKGVYILICRDPARAHVHVVVGAEATEHGFSNSRAERLERQIRRDLVNRGNDAALDYAVRSIADDLDRVVAGERWLSFLSIIGIGIGFWLLLVLIRSRIRPRVSNRPRAELALPPGPLVAPGAIQVAPVQPNRAPWSLDL